MACGHRCQPYRVSPADIRGHPKLTPPTSIINIQQAFIPHMLPNENPSIFINTGSKQGITNPPGNAAYNASKAAVKSLTEGLAHELRERHSAISAHLFMYVDSSRLVERAID